MVGMEYKYNHNYPELPKIKQSPANISKLKRCPHVDKNRYDSHVAKLVPFLFVFLVSIGQWFVNKSLFRYLDIRFIYLFRKSKKPATKRLKLDILPKVILFFLITICYDKNMPAKNCHDMKSQ